MHLKQGSIQAPDAGRVTAPARNRTAGSLGMLSAFLVSALFWAMPLSAQTSAALIDSTCGGTRAGSALGCTAKEFTVNAVVQNAPGSLPTCTIGGTAQIDVIIDIEGTNTDRQDVGLFVGQSGNDPGLVAGGPSNRCSVATFPTSYIPPPGDPIASPWENNDGDTCGDFNGNGAAKPLITGVKVLCSFGTNPADPATYGKLLFPYLLTYVQNNGAVCTGPDNVQPGTTSKCNKGVGTVSGITLTGYVDIIKQTLPDGDPTLFDFTVSGNAILSDPLDASFQLADGATRRIETVVDVTTRTMTIVETAALGWNPTASISCLNLTGGAAGAFVVTNGATRTITVSLDIANPGAVCTITNSKGVPLTLQKSWVNALTGDAVTVSTTGLTNNASLAAVANAPTEIDVGTPVDVVSGNVITITEGAFTTGAASNYNATLACVGNANPLSGNQLTVSPTDQAITCTYTNSRKAASFNIRKSWQNAVVNDAATVSTTGATTNVSLDAVAGTATEIDTATPVTAYAGDAITISELFTVGLPGNYNASVACTGTAGQVGNVVTIGAADTVVVCTQTNARTPVALTLRKTWANAIIGNAVTVSTTGGLNIATVASIAETANETDNGTAVEVFAGELITIGEIFGTGNAGNYNTTLACAGNSVPFDTANSRLTVAVGDEAITCTVTNARKSAQLTVRKTWAGAAVGDTVTVSTTGATNNANLVAIAATANETDTGTPVTVFVGEAVTISEAFSVGSQANYSSGLVCTGNNTVLAGSVLTVNALDTAITCTWTNTRASAGLSLAKTWVNALVGNAVTVSTTGATNNATLASTAGTPNETDTGSSVTVFSGEVLTISESFTTGSSANYASDLTCSGLSGGTTLVGNQLTIGSTPVAIVCTETNTRIAAGLTLAKTWVNAIVGNAVTVSTTGATNNASLSSTAATPNETDVGAAVTVFAGEQITIGESFTVGSQADYSSALSCTGLTGGTTRVGNVLTIGATPGAILCTQTNTRISTSLALAKTWLNAIVGNAVTVSTTGAANNASLASTAGTPSETDTGTAVTVFAGEVITISESFSNGSASNYTALLTCAGMTGGTTLVGNVLTISGTPGGPIVCTETNTRQAATLTLRKTWANAIVGNAVTVSTAGATNNTSLASTANTATETDTGSSVAVFAGEAISISEVFTTGALANYTASLACTGNATALAGNILTVRAGDVAIVCTQTNARRASTLTVRKTWVNATVGNAVTVSTTGAVNNASLASIAGSPNETDASTAVAVFAGEAITISETFTVGSASAYTSSLACTGNTTPLAGSVLTVNAADEGIVCTETNSRILFSQLTVTKRATPTTFVVGQPAAYTITVTNTGEAATVGNITLADTLATGISLVSAAGTNWICSGTTVLSCTFNGTLAPAASTSVTLNVTVGQSATNGNNSATASGGGDTTCPQASRCTGTVTVPIEPRGIALQIVKSANPVRVNAGSLVLYTLTITNIVNYNVVNAQVIDMPPNGLAYVPGSGTIYDSNASNNSVSGARPITFSGVDVAIGQTIRIQYLLRAGAALAAGEYTNFATAYQFGQPISNTASTTVYAETGADPLLEQTRILGKVFDDQNGDGWQDPGERGIPGVRIASVEGLMSETDAHGRYHIEGIVLLNQERGQNFVLKLDTATLPPGSSVTTENPHVRRITAAIPVRFDFGVKLPPMPISQAGSVDMALGEIHFLPGSTEIRPEYSGILDTMAEKIRTHQSGEVFIDSASGSSPLAFERAGKVRDQLIERLTPEQRNAFVINLRLQANDGTEGSVTLSDTVKLGEVLFDTDKSVIKPEFDALLDKVAAQIEAVGGGRVSVVGHADLRGSVEYNQALGLRRANAVFKRISERLSPEARQNLSVEVEGAAVVPGAGQ